jgi:hypothetical protein
MQEGQVREREPGPSLRRDVHLVAARQELELRRVDHHAIGRLLQHGQPGPHERHQVVGMARAPLLAAGGERGRVQSRGIAAERVAQEVVEGRLERVPLAVEEEQLLDAVPSTAKR